VYILHTTNLSHDTICTQPSTTEFYTAVCVWRYTDTFTPSTTHHQCVVAPSHTSWWTSFDRCADTLMQWGYIIDLDLYQLTLTLTTVCQLTPEWVTINVMYCCQPSDTHTWKLSNLLGLSWWYFNTNDLMKSIFHVHIFHLLSILFTEVWPCNSF